jgi:hypothetical protein
MTLHHLSSSAMLAVGICALVALGPPPAFASTPVGTEITYQGVLTDSGTPANGTYHLRFQLWDSLVGGSQVGSDVNIPAITVNDGLFTVPIDFGAEAFDGSARWLQVQVITNGGGTITTLSPRQPLTATPYALQTRGITVNDLGYVGIGTTTPGSPLTVDRPLSSTGSVTISGPTGVPGIVSWANNGNRRDIRFTNGGIGLYTRNSPDAPLTGNGLYIDESGHVGVGTSGPTAALHVNGVENNGSTAGLRIDSGSQAMLLDGNEIDSLSAGGLFLNNNSDFDVILANGGGRVGIGTTTPQARVEVFATSVDAIRATALSSAVGVFGESFGSVGAGVVGQASHTSGNNAGVYGHCSSPNGSDFFAAGPGENYGASSSIRWKSNIEPMVDPLEMVAHVRGVYFDWDAEHGGHHDVGMIAEEVGKVLPEIVIYEENGIDAKGMDYSKVTPLLVEAVKALREEKDRQIQEKDAEIAALKSEKDSEIASLRDEVAELKTFVRQLATQRITGESQP